ncbi:GM18430 [Drosophila sechellia]|uniref:GM18430 n=1 Tax=Drosophila sechellia TaxID=7238 RepID=B4I331_DROSE|nr:GM18430 [Drosophila sechellia]
MDMNMDVDMVFFHGEWLWGICTWGQMEEFSSTSAFKVDPAVADNKERHVVQLSPNIVSSLIARINGGVPNIWPNIFQWWSEVLRPDPHWVPKSGSKWCLEGVVRITA